MSTKEQFIIRMLQDRICSEYDSKGLERVYSSFFQAITYSTIIFLFILHWFPEGVLRGWLVVLVPFPLVLYCLWTHSRIRKFRAKQMQRWSESQKDDMEVFFEEQGAEKKSKPTKEAYLELVSQYCEVKGLSRYKRLLIEATMNYEFFFSGKKKRFSKDEIL